MTITVGARGLRVISFWRLNTFSEHDAFCFFCKEKTPLYWQDNPNSAVLTAHDMPRNELLINIHQFGRPSYLQIIWKQNKKKVLDLFLPMRAWTLYSTFHDFYKSLFSSKWNKGSRDDLMTFLDRSFQPAVSEYEQMLILARRKFGRSFG